MIDGGMQRSQVCRSNDEVLEVQEQWKVASSSPRTSSDWERPSWLGWRLLRLCVCALHFPSGYTSCDDLAVSSRLLLVMKIDFLTCWRRKLLDRVPRCVWPKRR